MSSALSSILAYRLSTHTEDEDEDEGLHISHANVAPSPVNNKQLGKEPELANGIVGGHGRLSSFQTGNADSNVSLLDHSDIVGT